MSIEVYFIRHGIAAERGTYANDEERPLTPEGDRKTRQIAQRLTELSLAVDLILTSPLIRAHQTAEILRNHRLSETVEEFAALSPDGSFHSWLTWLDEWRQSARQGLALVGHQPDLGDWAEQLIWGESRGRLILKKAGIIGVKVPKTGNPVASSELFWLTPPRFLL